MVTGLPRKGALPGKHALYGPLFRGGVLASGDCVSLAKHHIFSAEAEFGFVFARDMGPLAAEAAPYTEDDVWDAVSHVELCIELCGARQVRSDNKLHYVADSLLGACVVRGRPIARPPHPGSLTDVRVRLSVAGREIARGTAKANPFDSPLASVTFCVNELCKERGRPVEAGMLVLAGHTCQLVFKGRPQPPFVTYSAKDLNFKALGLP